MTTLVTTDSTARRTTASVKVISVTPRFHAGRLDELSGTSQRFVGKFEMRLLSRSCSSLVVMTAMASLHGCGSPPDSIRDRATPEESESEKVSTDRAANVAGLESQSEVQAPVSALEIANAPIKAFSRDEVSGAWIVSFADLNLKTALNLESITEDDVKQFPDWLKSLQGTKIQIRGYMYRRLKTLGSKVFA